MAVSKPVPEMELRGGLFECPVCLSAMNDRRPRALHCLHTFCEACLVECEMKGTKGSITCPACRDVTVLPKDGVIGLTQNFLLNQITSILRQEDNCQNCFTSTSVSRTASVFCNVCRQKFCDECKTKHEAITMFKDHRLIQLLQDELESGSKKCTSHGKALDKYCPECDEPICISCAINVRHSGHYDKLLNMKKESEGRINRAKELNISLKVTCCSLSESFEKTKTRLNEIDKMIIEEGKKQKWEIERQVKELRENLRNNYIKPLDKRAATVAELSDLIKTSEDLIQENQMYPKFLSEMDRLDSQCRHKNVLVTEIQTKERHTLVPEFEASTVSPRVGTLTAKISRKERIDALTKIGTRVQRGPDWKWDNQDGTPPSHGTVTADEKNGWVKVKWDEGDCKGYRVGAEGKIDLQLVPPI